MSQRLTVQGEDRPRIESPRHFGLMPQCTCGPSRARDHGLGAGSTGFARDGQGAPRRTSLGVSYDHPGPRTGPQKGDSKHQAALARVPRIKVTRGGLGTKKGLV